MRKLVGLTRTFSARSGQKQRVFDAKMPRNFASSAQFSATLPSGATYPSTCLDAMHL